MKKRQIPVRKQATYYSKVARFLTETCLISLCNPNKDWQSVKFFTLLMALCYEVSKSKT